MRGSHTVRFLFTWSLISAGGLLLLPLDSQARKRQPLRQVLNISDKARAALPRGKKMQAIQRFGLEAVALRRGFVKRHRPNYKVEVPISRPIQNQKKSGRCWAFATDRVLESKLQKKGKGATAISPSFVNYHALRQKSAALLLTSMLTRGKHPANLVSKMLGEGGTSGRALAIVKKYGVVPEEKMPTTADGAASGVFLNQLKRVLSRAQQSFAGIPAGKGAKGQRKATLRSYLKEVDTLLNATVGKPPRRFKINGKFYTPKTYARDFLGLKGKEMDYVALGNDPTKGWNRRYPVKGLGVAAYERYNVSARVLQEAVKKTVRGGEAVYFSTNVSADNIHRVKKGDNIPREAQGILSLKAFDYQAYIPTRRLSKRARVRSGISTANHAMTITGYDPGRKGSVRKWKVDNSWGTDIGDNGRLHMYNDFFRHYMREVVVPRSSVPRAILAKIEARPMVSPKKPAKAKKK